MGLFFTLLSALLLAGTSSIRINPEFSEFRHPALRLPLYHVRGQGPDSLQKSATPLSFSDALALDNARVKFLSSRLNNPTTSTTESDQSMNGKSLSVPLNPGESIGVANYYTRIGLGTPPTDHLVVVDTGSSFSWIQCEPCSMYCHPQVGSPFNPTSSSTYEKLSCNSSQCSSLKVATLNSPSCTSSNTCQYTATYGDQSFSLGDLSRDTLSFSMESVQGFVFGCGQENYGLFGKSSGLIGLARNELSMLSQLSTKYEKAFSYCLPTSTPLGKSGSGGFLSIGNGSNLDYKFTPMLSDSRDPGLYFLKLITISVSGKPLPLDASAYGVSTIIDSGTTISRLATPVYSALRTELVKIISTKFQAAEAYSLLDACFNGSSAEVAKVVPEVGMVFQGGAELSLEPHNVIIEVTQGKTCVSFAGNSNDMAIIGNQQQQTFEIVYDVGSSRIGFASGGCH